MDNLFLSLPPHAETSRRISTFLFAMFQLDLCKNAGYNSAVEILFVRNFYKA